MDQESKPPRKARKDARNRSAARKGDETSQYEFTGGRFYPRSTPDELEGMSLTEVWTRRASGTKAHAAFQERKRSDVGAGLQEMQQSVESSGGDTAAQALPTPSAIALSRTQTCHTWWLRRCLLSATECPQAHHLFKGKTSQDADESKKCPAWKNGECPWPVRLCAFAHEVAPEPFVDLGQQPAGYVPVAKAGCVCGAICSLMKTTGLHGMCI